MPGVTGSPVSSAECRVCSSAVSSPSRIQSVRPSGSPLSKTDGRGRGRVSAHERRALEPGRRRVGAQRAAGAVGQPLADPGAAAGPAEDRAALVGVARRRRPVQRRSAGRRPALGRQDRVVAAGGRARCGARPSRAGARSSASSAATSTSVKSRVAAADPGGRGCGRVRLAGDLDPAGRLVVPQPQPGRRCRGRSSSASCSAKPNSSRPPGPGRGRTPRRAPARTRSKTADRGLGRRRRPSRRRSQSGSTSGAASSAGPAVAGRVARPRDERGDRVEVDVAAATRRRRRCPRRRRPSR